MLNVNLSSACFANRSRRPLRSGTCIPSAVRNGGRIGICRLAPFGASCPAFPAGKIISNSYTQVRTARRERETSKIVRCVEMPRVSNRGMKLLFKVVFGVNGWKTSGIDNTEE